MSSLHIPDWVEQLRAENQSDPWLQRIHTQILRQEAKVGFQVKDGLLFFNDRFCLGPSSSLQTLIFTELHGSRMGGHAGIYWTLARIRLRFFWVGMNRNVREFVRDCRTCQQVKIPPSKPSGLLQPLPIPTAVWEEISMDFVTRLPTVAGRSVIMVVVDRLSKYCHLSTLLTNYTVASVAENFIHHIVCLHGIPKKIVSDWDRVFISKF